MTQDPYGITFNDGPRLLFVYAQLFKPHTNPVLPAQGGAWLWLRVDTITQIMSPIMERAYSDKPTTYAVVVVADGVEYHVAQTPLIESDAQKAQGHLIDRVANTLFAFGPRR